MADTSHTTLGHTSYVLSAAFSHDGLRVVTASLDNTARVWEAATGACLRVLAEHTDDVNSAAFSHDGRRIVTASDDRTARVWEVEPAPAAHAEPEAPVEAGGAAMAEAVTPPGAGSGGSRMHADVETALTAVPGVDWSEWDPKRRCIEELQRNERIRARVPRIDAMVEDIRFKVLELQYTPVPVQLDENCTVAIVAYTHDLGLGRKDGNLYFELNVMLRVRDVAGRDTLKATWGGYMFFFVKGLASLPNYAGLCWRGYNHGTQAQILQEYKLGRPIQWGAFTSVTTSRAAAESFTPQSRVLFKIAVTSGRDINAYSFFPHEGEILLSPSARFIVSSEPRTEGGFLVIDLVQAAGNTFVS